MSYSEFDSDFIPFYNTEGEFHYGVVVKAKCYISDEMKTVIDLTIQGCTGRNFIRLFGVLPRLLNSVGMPLIRVRRSEDSEWLLDPLPLVFRKAEPSDEIEHYPINV